MINFKKIDYLKTGNTKQREVFRIITEHRIVEILKIYQPLLVGTIPIDIDIANSDIDIILEAKDLKSLNTFLLQNFSKYKNYNCCMVETDKLVCNFEIDNMLIELFATDQKTDQQNGYLHMIKEYEILQCKGADFAQQVRALKISGLKTEPAFCQLLTITGDPYVALLRYKTEDKSSE